MSATVWKYTGYCWKKHHPLNEAPHYSIFGRRAVNPQVSPSRDLNLYIIYKGDP